MSGAGIGGALGTGLGVLLAPETGGLSMAIPAIAGAAGSALGGGLTGGNVLEDALMGGIGGGLTGGLGGGLDAGDLFGDTAASGAEGVGADIGGDAATIPGGDLSYGMDDAMSGADGEIPASGVNAGDQMAGDTAAQGAQGSGNSGGSILDSIKSALMGSDNNPTGVAIPNGPDAKQLIQSGANGDYGDAPGISSFSPAAGNNASIPYNSVNSPAGSSSSGDSGILSQIGQSAAKNPLGYAGAGALGISALQSLLNPLPKYNVAGTANSVMATNPGFNASLPKYTMQNTATPYTGNWYTYGEQPQAAMYNATPQPAKRGGLMKYAHGGRVQHMAMGGPAMPMGAPPQIMPQGAPNQPAPMMPSQAQNPLAMAPKPSMGMPPQQGMPPQKPPVNPLAIKAAHNIGLAIGKHIKSKMMTPDGRVKGHGGGQDDIVPARLSQDEFVLPADIPAALGDGSSNEGAKRLTKMMHNIRAHKTSKGAGFPPKAHNPLKYLPKGKAS